MPQKLRNMTDPAALQNDGVDRIKWVEFDGGVQFTRRSGKAVALYALYRKADANSSNLAGFFELAEVGTSTSDTTSVSSNQMLPVNMGPNKSSVMPTSNRAAVEADKGSTFNLLLNSDGRQFIDMNSTFPGVVVVQEVLDDDGAWVSVKIPEDRLWGNI